MIRAFCTICQDLILTGHEASTGQCGHVFHQTCLSSWLNRNKTCPKCRHKVTKAITLFMDEPNDSDIQSSSVDTSVLMDQLEQQRSMNKEKERQKEYLSSEIKRLEEKMEDYKEKCNSSEKKLNNALAVSTSLRKQMAYLKQQEGECAQAKQEAITCRQELNKFKRLKHLVEGTRHDAEDMLNRIGDGMEGSRSAQELVTQLVILKRELEKIKESRNRARDHKEMQEREISRLRNELSTKEVEIKRVTDQLCMAESDLTRVEKESASLKKKLSKLEQAFNSPSPRSSAITRLMRESPAPMEFKRPRLTPPEKYDENQPLASNQPSSGGVKMDPELENAAKEMGLTLVKTTSFSTKPAVKKLSNPLLPQARKRPLGERETGSSSAFRTGYDGLGGHSTKFVKPNKPVKQAKVARPNTLSRFVKTTKDGKEPPLPVMTLDFT
ncbi:predicted protein [Nematostella vectensis]|uniref:RING-type domain-containing protein n=1 Tax=Nematostella vectensis TaxID=45351 RepID=A7S600_NEMVE|nr:predicted protein [Nematostella vectensis]|eukprot:XP_001632912.1 predicted protein [Nematostella vectensis]